MIPLNDLKKIANARLKDAEILYGNERFDGAFYLCGYAVEIALKARICKTLKWSGFPDQKNEFDGYQSFKTHSLVTLIHLSGIEDKIKTRFTTDWLVVTSWNPERRYKLIGSITSLEAYNVIEAAKKLLKVL